MDDMEREALRRAEKMRSAFYSSSNVHKKKEEMPSPPKKPTPKERNLPKEEHTPNKEQTPKAEHIPKEEEIPFEPLENGEKEGGKDIFDFLLKDKETTFILLMIFFLYDENADPMLMMALIYLLVG
ncbi:MAG: hypothetical protein MSH11_01130 [Ruminococcus sp.]|nr:hypothetical protein [Ruminococcus sp.]